MSDSGQTDPHRHWDGQRWLSWNGREWVPEVADVEAATAPPPAVPDAAGSNPPASRRPVVRVVGAVVVLAAVAVGVYFATRSGGSSGGSGTSESTDSGSQVAYPTRAATCTIEMNVAVDITVNHDASLYNVIGTSSPLFSLSTQALIKFESLMGQVGANEAESQIIPTLESLCRQAGNPILTQAQVTGMADVAQSSDADSLNQVTIFASGVGGK